MTCETIPLVESEDHLQIVSLKAYHTILHDVNSRIMKSVLFFALSALLSIVIIMYFSHSFSGRVERFLKQMQKVAGGSFELEEKLEGNDEISELYDYLGTMIYHIQRLLAEVYQEKLHAERLTIQQKEAEFKMLASQINPHFLYNTLDIIVWMIENEQKQEAVKVVTALARFFRISLSKGKSIIPVRDELEHVRNYLMIQQMRFKNKFTYEIEAGEDVMELACLKLLLQPLVENAIYHGMEFMDGDGEIRVRAFREEDSLWFEISDNGLGMTGEQVEGLLSEKPQVRSGRGSGIGVKNVNERIELYFGKPYGLIIESEPDEGTVIRIHLPVKMYAEAMEKE